jgi:hypothetical protein
MKVYHNNYEIAIKLKKNSQRTAISSKCPKSLGNIGEFSNCKIIYIYNIDMGRAIVSMIMINKTRKGLVL